MRDKFRNFWREGESTDPVAGLRREVERVFEDFGLNDGRFRNAMKSGDWSGVGGGFGSMFSGAPKVDVARTADGVEIHAELPGLKPDEVDVSVEGDSIVIRGERRGHADQAGREWSQRERSFGAFSRRVQLPFEPDPAGVTARFDHGVLTVTAPKPQPASGGVRVKVQGGSTGSAEAGAGQGGGGQPGAFSSTTAGSGTHGASEARAPQPQAPSGGPTGSESVDRGGSGVAEVKVSSGGSHQPSATADDALTAGGQVSSVAPDALHPGGSPEANTGQQGKSPPASGGGMASEGGASGGGASGPTGRAGGMIGEG